MANNNKRTRKPNINAPSKKSGTAAKRTVKVTKPEVDAEKEKRRKELSILAVKKSAEKKRRLKELSILAVKESIAQRQKQKQSPGKGRESKGS